MLTAPGLKERVSQETSTAREAIVSQGKAIALLAEIGNQVRTDEKEGMGLRDSLMKYGASEYSHGASLLEHHLRQLDVLTQFIGQLTVSTLNVMLDGIQDLDKKDKILGLLKQLEVEADVNLRPDEGVAARQRRLQQGPAYEIAKEIRILLVGE